MKSYKWKVLSEIILKSDSKIEQIIDILLENRGINPEDKEEFLNPKFENIDLKSVGIDELQVKKTLKRIKKAIDSGEKIFVYGDYDVDGICGTAILWETIYSTYKEILPYIPHRAEEGYGLSVSGIDHIIKEHGRPGLIITVDNGIVASDAIEYANRLGIDVIITDHHVPGDKKPSAFSIVHTTKLCGAGVAYMLAREIARKVLSMEIEGEGQMELVALATVADLVPLLGASRVFVKYGIEKLKKTQRPGLQALFEQAQIRKDKIGTYEIGHMLAPRLNAAGRITHAMDSLRLICTKDPLRAKKLALHLSETNKNRQLITAESTLHADSVTEISNSKFIFVADKTYNQGVIGLIASRLVEKHYKPAVVISVGEKVSKGSARSVAGFNIIEFLRTQSSFLVDAGGHPMAAGFTIETRYIEKFKTALLETSAEVIKDEILEKLLNIDFEIPLEILSDELFSGIQRLAPFGMGNREPVFLTRGAVIENMKFLGSERRHLKFILVSESKKVEAIFFSAGERNLNIGDKIDVVYQISKDEWNGNSKLVLKVKDLAITAPAN